MLEALSAVRGTRHRRPKITLSEEDGEDEMLHAGGRGEKSSLGVIEIDKKGAAGDGGAVGGRCRAPVGG